MKKEILMPLVVLLSFSFNAQVSISEVYLDTPFSEMQHQHHQAHKGEFIELFNYSSEDVDISRWRLSDNYTSYYFPDGTVIKSNDFLILAKKIGNQNYFFDLFPNEKSGNEGKVLYQSSITLNNYKDRLILYAKTIDGVYLKAYQTIHYMSWDCSRDGRNCNENSYDEQTDENTPNYNPNYNYYLPSIQKRGNQDFQDISSSLSDMNVEIATPFRLNFTPEILDFDEIDRIDEILNNHFNSLTIDERVAGYINTICNTTIPKISAPSVSDNYIEDVCFHSDAAGNMDYNINCSTNNDSETIIDPVTGEYNLNVIANKIFLTPNPTSGHIELTWENEISALISDAAIVPMNGSSIEVPFNFNRSNNSATVNISQYSDGIYIVRVLLDSGELITKTVIKI